MTRADLLRVFTYDGWANREALASVRPVADGVPKSVALIAHIAAAKHLWLARIRGAPAPMAVWPALTLEECADALATARGGWTALLRSDGGRDLARAVAYTNSKGQAFRSTVADIGVHVVLHGHYHRGQIAALVRAAGHEPAYTDFIHAVRTNVLASEEVEP